jgi:hypothetical protein
VWVVACVPLWLVGLLFYGPEKLVNIALASVGWFALVSAAYLLVQNVEWSILGGVLLCYAALAAAVLVIDTWDGVRGGDRVGYRKGSVSAGNWSRTRVESVRSAASP